MIVSGGKGILLNGVFSPKTCRTMVPIKFNSSWASLSSTVGNDNPGKDYDSSNGADDKPSDVAGKENVGTIYDKLCMRQCKSDILHME